MRRPLRRPSKEDVLSALSFLTVVAVTLAIAYTLGRIL